MTSSDRTGRTESAAACRQRDETTACRPAPTRRHRARHPRCVSLARSAARTRAPHAEPELAALAIASRAVEPDPPAAAVAPSHTSVVPEVLRRPLEFALRAAVRVMREPG